MDVTSRRGFLKLAGLGAMARQSVRGRPLPKRSRSPFCTRARSSRRLTN